MPECKACGPVTVAPEAMVREFWVCPWCGDVWRGTQRAMGADVLGLTDGERDRLRNSRRPFLRKTP